MASKQELVDSFSQAISDVTGLKTSELPQRATDGQDVLANHVAYLESKGFRVRRQSRAQSPDTHVVIYSDAHGIPQAVVSDSPGASRVEAVSALFITKPEPSAKPGDSKAQ